MEERIELSLAEKLKACANQIAERIRGKNGEDARLPGSVRLMFSAADYIKKQEEEIEELKSLYEKARKALAEDASCASCKNGPEKKCSVRGECGKNHSLWDFDPSK